MSTKADYSAEEWDALTGAPVAAELLVALADTSGSVGVAREVSVVGKAIGRATSREGPEIVKALAESVKSTVRPELPQLAGGDRTEAKTVLLGAIKRAVRTIEQRSPSEVEVYKAWLASIAAKVSQAVSGEEKEALEQLAEILGASTRKKSRPS